MDSGALLTKAKKTLGAQILESGRLSRGGDAVVWVSAQGVPDALKKLRDDSELKLDFLENVSALHLDGAIVLSYFLRSSAPSTDGALSLVVRSSLEPKKTDPKVYFPSVSALFGAAIPQEREIAEMFGVVFEGLDAGDAILPVGWEGFPLRKDYAFPRAFMSIPHVRNAEKEGPV